MSQIEQEYRYETGEERRERLDEEIAEAVGRVELYYESQNARSVVSVRGRLVEPQHELEQLHVHTSERESDLVIDHNYLVRTAVPYNQSEGRHWKHSMGDAVAVKNLAEEAVGRKNE